MKVPIHFNLQDKYFELVESGRKTAEGRIYKPKLSKLKVGDVISFSPNSYGNKILLAKVSYVKVYDSFEKMLSGGELKYLLPDVYSAEEAISIYESFGSYKSDQFIYGVVSIGFKLKG